MGYFKNSLNKSIIEDWQNKLEELAGSWNGEDSTFNHEGDVFTEQSAHDAQEAIELLEKVKEIFDRINY